jgi:hypothetical protein
MRLSSFRLPTDHLSATQLGVAVTCPEQYRLRYLLREPERLNVEKLIGSAFHQALAANWDWKIHNGSDLNQDDAWTSYQDAWDSTIESEGEPEWKQTPDSLLHTSELMLSSYMTDVAPTISPISTEAWFSERLPSIPVPVVGAIDLETTSLVKEVKTTGQKVSRPKPQWRLQAKIYQLVTRKPVEHQVVTRQETPKIYTSASEPGLLTPLSPPDATLLLLQRIVSSLNDLYARFGANTPWPANGVLHPFCCSYCSYRGHCYAWAGEASE